MTEFASTALALVAALQVAISGGTRVWGSDQGLKATSASASASTAGTPSGSSYTYGEPASDPSSQYNGRVYDPGTGFHDYGARMYWPEIGRFISADSYQGDPANPASLNRYSYVHNNPYKYTDPTGHVIELAGGASSRMSTLLALQQAVGPSAAPFLCEQQVDGGFRVGTVPWAPSISGMGDVAGLIASMIDDKQRTVTVESVTPGTVVAGGRVTIGSLDDGMMPAFTGATVTAEWRGLRLAHLDMKRAT